MRQPMGARPVDRPAHVHVRSRWRALPGRLGSWFGAFFAGAFVAFLGTIAHQATVTLAGLQVPWGLILGISAVLALTIGLRLALESRGLALAASLGVFGAIFLFSAEGAGGSVLVPANSLGVLWNLAPGILSLGVVIWPRLPGRRGA